MIDFLTIVLLIFGVLQIILFFKVWGMTNDIKEIRNKYLKEEDKTRKEERKQNTLLLKSAVVLNPQCKPGIIPRLFLHPSFPDETQYQSPFGSLHQFYSNPSLYKHL